MHFTQSAISLALLGSETWIRARVPACHFTTVSAGTTLTVNRVCQPKEIFLLEIITMPWSGSSLTGWAEPISSLGEGTVLLHNSISPLQCSYLRNSSSTLHTNSMTPVNATFLPRSLIESKTIRRRDSG